MSAICGIWNRNGSPVDPAELDRMMAPLAYRGKDGTTTWRQGDQALGYHHTCSTPESVYERLPYVHPSGNWTIVADARIDNRSEVFNHLGMTDTPTMPDSELILQAYIKWGSSCPTYLLGDFIFVIVDNVQQTMFCARDHFGVRPFYYHLSDQHFAFASELTAIRQLPYVTQNIDESRVVGILMSELDDMVRTCYTDVLRLSPGTTATVSRTQCTHSTYWRLDPARELPEASDEEYAAEFHAIFTRAVECRVRSIRPVGAMLSGGLDSSSNVVTARKFGGSHFPGQLQTFSATFGRLAHDESEYIDAVIAQGGVDSHKVDCESLRPLDWISEGMEKLGQFYYGPNFCVHMELYRLGAAAGVQTVLEGFDGDSTVSHGVARLRELVGGGQWGSAIREARAFAGRLGRPRNQFVLKHVGRAMVPTFLQSMGRQLRPRSTNTISNSILHPRLAHHLGRGKRPIDPAEVALLARPGSLTRVKHYAKLAGGFFPMTFETVEPMSLSYGMRTVYPYCDVRLMEFCLALPAAQKLRDGWSRYVMHQAMTDLPHKVRWRAGKTMPTPIVAAGMHRFHQDLLKQTVHEPAAQLESFLALPQVEATYNRYMANRSVSDAIALWKSVAMNIWLKDRGCASTV